MQNAATQAKAKAAAAFGPAEIRALEDLSELERTTALRSLGLPTISGTLREWEAKRDERLAFVRRLETEKRDFLKAASLDQRRTFNDKLQVAKDDIVQADELVISLTNFIALARFSEIDDGTRAFGAAVLGSRGRVETEFLSHIEEGFELFAKGVTIVRQFNLRASTFNRILPEGCEAVPLLRFPIVGRPNVPWLDDYIASFFPVQLRPNKPAVELAPVSADLPDAVKHALAKADADKRAAVAAARGAHRGQGNTAEPGAWQAPESHALPPRAPEPAAPDPAPAFRSGKR